jgi:hypothetical protein
VRLPLENAHKSGKTFDLWAIFLPPPTGFLHIRSFRTEEMPLNTGFPAISGLAAELQ